MMFMTCEMRSKDFKAYTRQKTKRSSREFLLHVSRQNFKHMTHRAIVGVPHSIIFPTICIILFFLLTNILKMRRQRRGKNVTIVCKSIFARCISAMFMLKFFFSSDDDANIYAQIKLQVKKSILNKHCTNLYLVSLYSL